MLFRSLVVLRADFDESWVREEVFASFGKWSPGFMLNTIFFHIFMGNFLLMEHMRFNLIHGRSGFSEAAEVDQAVRVEVRNTDRANPSL